MIKDPLKMVSDDRGELVEVIITAADFKVYLQSLITTSDWELLPEHVQDAADRLLIDEVRHEKEDAALLSANKNAIQLIEGWLDDDSDYDKQVWPTMKKAIDENRLSHRSRFAE